MEKIFLLKKHGFVAPIHDSRHFLSNDPFARESLVYMLQLPEHDVACFVYTWVNGLGKAGSAFVVYGPAVGESIAERCDGIEVSDSADFGDWKVGGVHVCHTRPFETATVTARGERTELFYEFEAVHPAYDYDSHKDGCPGWIAENRIEQSGRVKGILTIDGRKIPFETMGHHDHSWGTRNWNFSQHWKWLEAQAGPDLIVHVWEVQAIGRTVVRGYVVREGEMSEVASVTFHFTHNKQMDHTSLTAVITDELGRVTRFAGKVFALYPLVVGPNAVLNEGSMAVEIEGKRGVGHVELFWPIDYLEYIRESDLSSGSKILRGLEEAAFLEANIRAVEGRR